MVTNVIKVSTNLPLTIRFIVFLMRRLGFASYAFGFLGLLEAHSLAAHRFRKPCLTSTAVSLSLNSSGMFSIVSFAFVPSLRMTVGFFWVSPEILANSIEGRASLSWASGYLLVFLECDISLKASGQL